MSEDNVIHASFGGSRPGPRESDLPDDPVAPPRALGTAAGHRVGLVRDPSAPEGDVFRVVVGREGGCAAETVALLPTAPEAEAEAERIGFAVLRALEILEGAV